MVRQGYGVFEIWQAEVELPLLTLDLASRPLDGTTAVLGSGFRAKTPAGNVLKATLDTVEDRQLRFLPDAAINLQVDGPRAGFSKVIRWNYNLPGGVEGCMGVARSQSIAGEDVIFNMAVGCFQPGERIGSPASHKRGNSSGGNSRIWKGGGRIARCHTGRPDDSRSSQRGCRR